LISLIECKDGDSTTDIICASLFFSVLRTALCGPEIPKEILHSSRGCVICPNGKMLLTDNNEQNLVILNNDGALDKEITCSPYPPRDVTLIDDSTVAVSTSGDVRIINICYNCYQWLHLLAASGLIRH
jgi:hypothetical protein